MIDFEKLGMVIDGIKYVYGKEAVELFQSGAILVDLREDYLKNGRIFDVPKVISIPHQEFEKRLKELPSDKILVLADFVGIISKHYAHLLIEKGFKQIAVLSGGIVDWEKDGMPIIIDKDNEFVGGCTCQLKPRKFTQTKMENIMKKVLFVCIHNSARSQMAEAYLNHLGNGKFHAESAGIEPGKLNPVVIEAMRLDGIDISKNLTKTVDSMIESGKTFDYLITVCDETSAERCPYYPGAGKKLHFGFPDPSAFKGTFEEKLEQTIKVRDEIKKKIIEFISSYQD